MPIYTDKRSGRFFVQFDYKKQTYKQYLPEAATRTDAKKLEVKMWADVFFQRQGLKQPDEIIFEDFVQETFLPHVLEEQGVEAFKKAENICVSLKPFVRGLPLREIKPEMIERFKVFRTKLPVITWNSKKKEERPRQPSTVVSELAVVSKLFALAVKNDICEYNPCSRVSKPKFDNLQDKVLDPADDEAFFAAFDKEQGSCARDVCELVLHTGLSQKDVLGLTPFNVILKDRMIRLTRSKTKRRVLIPLNETAYEICRRRMRSGGPLFISEKTGKPPKSVKTAMAGACRRANIPVLTIRDLRRTFATRLMEADVDPVTISWLLGHASLRMIPRYVRTVQSMRRAVDKYAETYAGDQNEKTQTG